MIADDHPVFCIGMQNYLGQNPNIEVLPPVHNGREAIARIKIDQPDILLQDIVMPEMDGASLAAWVRVNSPQTKILVISGYFEERQLSSLVETGIDGFVSKNAPVSEIMRAVDAILSGDLWFGTDISTLIERVRLAQNDTGPAITPREADIIRLSCKGMQYKEIAEHLGISYKTVDNIKSNLFHKLNVSNTTELVIYAFRNHLVEI